jgi:ubiquinone/menaquinone biosynthesis C-methylase UbiE
VLRRLLQDHRGAHVLELASGTGQHVAHFARALPQLSFQPSDLTPELFDSIAAHCTTLPNVQPPVVLDATWPPECWAQRLGQQTASFDLVQVANLTHIAPWAATEGLIAGAALVLRPGGLLCIYGPFKLQGVFTTASNRAFHEHLEAR